MAVRIARVVEQRKNFTVRTAEEFRVQPSSDFSAVLRELAELEFDFAASHLATVESDAEHAVHQCRRAIKRLRALVRLGVGVDGIRPRSIDRRLRDTGRALAQARDATEVANTLSALLDRHSWLRTLRGIDLVAMKSTAAQVPTRKALRRLKAAQSLLPELFAESGWTLTSIASGIKQTYQRGAIHMERFSQCRSDRLGHSWRKDVQRLGNQLRILRALCPDRLASTLQPLDELSRLLGEHNDLSVLRALVKRRRKRLPGKTRRALLEVAGAQQTLLRRHALLVGSGVFAFKPKEFRDALIRSACDSVVDV